MPIDTARLRDQYTRRSHSDIAAELRINVMTVIAAARRHGAPSRPKGVHSRPSMITSRDVESDWPHIAIGTLRKYPAYGATSL
jgi:hypothetical protein